MNRTAAGMGAVLVTAIAAALSGCHAQASREEQGRSTAAPGNPLEITVTPSLEKRIRVGEPRSAAVAGTLAVSGRIEADETREARIGTPVTGRVVELFAVEGQSVRKGQVLATLNSTELTDAQVSLLKAYSQQQLAQRAAERAQLLLDAGVIGSAELQRRQTELAQASAEVSASRDQLKVLGMPEEAIARLQNTRSVTSSAQVVASIDGIVLERHATVGQVVQPADTIFTLADLSNVWVIADVPEQAAGNIKAGKIAETEISAFPGQIIRGKLSYVSSLVNPETRTVRVRMDLPNPQRKYKPAMLATMSLKEGVEMRRVLPITAIVRENNQEFVFAQTGERKFALRPVTLGAEYENVRVLVDGIAAGEKVVLDGAFHLNNERNRLALQGEAN